MTSVALKSIAERAAGYTIVQRKNQLSKLCWFASDNSDFTTSRDSNYFVC
ncbi:MAG TPA: hypothetical protein O0X48_04175 [Methanocorpusculum sp.]|nr:hypothetical protein [Methanocorpusculum sp.]MBR5814701.1 hypothetical protein [Methanocorpusculaceae archaeon]MBR5008772.1 hypothetical protein [Methanocorpusculum sp.]MBR5450599.1 hypothetical protein [Methanocorpusculum sp.]HJJ65483.1 hypothetical protein [Methanocorpusculum sp.]